MLPPVTVKLQRPPPKDFSSSFSETLAVAIDLSEAVLKDLKEGSLGQFDKFLESDLLSGEINKALAKYVHHEHLRKNTVQGSAFNTQYLKNNKQYSEFNSVSKLLQKNGSKFAGDTFKKHLELQQLQDDIKKILGQNVKVDATALTLKGHFSKLAKDFSNTKTGVFVDKNKKLLIIVGSLTVVGGVVAFYRTGSGDAVMKGVGEAVATFAKKIDLGALDIGVKDLEFKPSEGLAGGTIKLSPEMKKKSKITSCNFNINSKFDKSGFVSGYLSNDLKIKLTDFSSLGYSAKGGLVQKNLNYEYLLNVNYSKSGTKVDLQAYVKVDDLTNKKDLGGKFTLNSASTIVNKKTGNSSKLNAYLGGNVNKSLVGDKSFDLLVDFGIRWTF